MSGAYYEDDLVTLYHGDSREMTEWLAADVLVTDPPYGVGYVANRGGTRHVRGDVSIPVANDHDFSTAAAVLAMWPRSVACFASHQSLPATLAAVSTRLSRLRVMAWHKSNVNGAGGMGNPWMADIEFAVCGVTKWPAVPRSGVVAARRWTGNPDWTSNPDAFLHPTQKPLRVMEHVIDLFPEGIFGPTIADPFAGSGSTLVAAKQLGRRAIGVELEERYCEIAAKRLAQDVLFGGVA